MKQKPTLTDLPARMPSESDDAYNRRLSSFLRGDDIGTKTDLRSFRTCDFTLAPERGEQQSICWTCQGRGEIGHFDSAENGYRTERCPSCDGRGSR